MPVRKRIVDDATADVGRWRKAGFVPDWVDAGKVELDQFYTLPATAAACYNFTKEMLKARGEDMSRLFFVEPAAGLGAFSDLFPEDRRLALDLEPQTPYTVQADYLSWQPDPDMLSGRVSVAMGTPPFGLDGWYALAFLNKTAQWADYAAFILPGAFTIGDANPIEDNVQGMSYIGGFSLPEETFYIDGDSEKVKEAVFQIWEKDDRREHV